MGPLKSCLREYPSHMNISYYGDRNLADIGETLTLKIDIKLSYYRYFARDEPNVDTEIGNIISLYETNLLNLAILQWNKSQMRMILIMTLIEKIMHQTCQIQQWCIQLARKTSTR